MIDLRLGDCLEVMKTLPDGSVDAVVTDPPYGLMEAAGKVQMRGKVTQQDYGDWDRSYSFDWIVALPPCRAIISFHDQRRASEIAMAGESHGWKLKRYIFWDKGDGGLNPRRNFVNCVEMAAFLTRDGYRWNGGATARNIYRLGRQATPLHPTQKPERLMKWLIGLITQEGDTVLDPFMGSGTTGVACVQTGRNFIGVEIDEGYFKIAKRRIEEAQLQMRLPLETT